MQPLAANERPGEAGQSEDPNSQPEFTWDEFGFRVEEEDGPEDSSNKLLSIPFVESPKVIQVKYLYLQTKKVDTQKITLDIGLIGVVECYFNP